jgi:hypothetical protein
MNTKPEHTEDLIEEISRYLAAIELFRSVGCEPSWRPESVRPTPLLEAVESGVLARRAH